MTLPFSTVNTEHQTVLSDLAGLPPKPPRSKLEPHRELIRELRRKGRTYREVARLFHERLGTGCRTQHPPLLREGPREASQTNAI